MKTIAANFARPASAVLAAALGFALGACGPASESRMNKVCKRFCERQFDCNDGTDVDDCIDGCVDEAMSCDSDDDVADALDILDECSTQSCNEVPGCLAEAWLECKL